MTSPPPAIEILFVTVAGAVVVTFTVIVIGGAVASAPITALVLQVTTCPVALQVHPEPVPLT